MPDDRDTLEYILFLLRFQLPIEAEATENCRLDASQIVRAKVGIFIFSAPYFECG
jgi:hypothetical protein